MGYALLLTLAGMLQGVMVSLNGQLNGWFDPITVAFFVHSIPTVLLILYLKVYRHAKIFAKASVPVHQLLRDCPYRSGGLRLHFQCGENDQRCGH